MSTWLCTIAKKLYLNMVRRERHPSLDTLPEPAGGKVVTDALIRADRQRCL